MPVGFGKRAIKSRGRPLSVMAHLKRSVLEVKAAENCLALAIIIAIQKWKMTQNIKHIGKVERHVL
jgi:NADH:ubiquinone oxidoreductase subunit K